MKHILLLAVAFAFHHCAGAQSANTDSLARVLDAKSQEVERKVDRLIQLSNSLQRESRRPSSTPPRRSSLAVARPRTMPAGRQAHSIAPVLPVDSAVVSNDPEAALPTDDQQERGGFWQWLRDLFHSIFHPKQKPPKQS